ncbi:BQ2448_645 [Microbotryum intermedium]|uniref:Phospholipid-transporting ATPase n=1 Tax=Microbotryum intermedium TaxID=269621 RepID=A0A238F9I6_9BASI|nr:BQ2448_645 [Microbotryum intermedium]
MNAETHSHGLHHRQYDSDDEDLAIYSPGRTPDPNAQPYGRRGRGSSNAAQQHFASNTDPFANQNGVYDDTYGGQSQNPAAYGGGQAASRFGPAVDASHPSERLAPVPTSARYDSEAYDPFFDDDDPAAGSQLSLPYERPQFARDASNYSGRAPLTQNAQVPAGHAQGQIGESASRSVQNVLDQDDPELVMAQARIAAAQARKRPGQDKGFVQEWISEAKRIIKGLPKTYTGERLIHIGNPAMNAPSKFSNNSVSTSKYNLITFLPKFFFEQFSKYANIFFLFTACIQQIPNVSPTNRWTTIAPLSLVLLVAALKEMQEDIKRHQSDADLNSRKAKVLNGAHFEDRAWRNIKVGDIVRLESNDFFPADLVLLSSSEPEGLCYIETSNLDGETNLKIKQASPVTATLTSPPAVAQLIGQLRCEQPNNSLYTFEATLSMNNLGNQNDVPLGPDQILLRGAQLRNTAWMYGLVVFTGHETKLMRNATAAPIKRTAMERMVNVQILFLLAILMALSIACAIGSTLRNHISAGQMWYLMLGERPISARVFIEDVLTFVLTLNNLIPISLIVTMEVVKFQQAALINSDLDMYHPVTDTPALCRTSSLVEELGQIEYIFSDKTGTLTCNEMEFRQCSIGGIPYADIVDESKKGEVFSFTEMRDNLTHGHETAEVIEEFLTLLATCHTVIPEVGKEGQMTYQASSPDEAALVAGADVLGYRFTTRKPQSIYIEALGEKREYQVLNILEFNSTRKRMSSIVRGPDGKIKLYCKGADTVIFERLSGSGQVFTDSTMTHLEEYATEGLRTLCIAMREIPEDEYKKWSVIHDKAAATVNGRGEALEKAAEIIEKDLFLLGATAIEDKLQEGVPDTIYTLQQAGIKIWVLTGDRQETAINIGLSCRLISESMSLVIVNETNAHDTKDFLTKRLEAVKNSRNAGDFEELALVIDGKSLGFALEKDMNKTFLELAVMCKAVVCCDSFFGLRTAGRVSPLQKALVVKLVKKHLNAILLAIGDGANDVSMIQAAHVGVGISGVEGLQAARSADVAISQFRFLKKLLLVHGTWSYQRLSKLILYSFYKNIALYMTGFWFAFQNSFSGQVIVESWTLTFYNVLFTVLPPVVLGVFDQFVGARMLDRYPELYKLGQQNKFFSVRIFWQWIANALVHSFIIYAVTVAVFWGDLILPQGWVGGEWMWGTTLYLAALLAVLAKAALISDIWTKYTVLAIPGSFVFTMVFLPIYALIAPLLGFSLEYKGIVPRLWVSAVFWMTILGLPVLLLTRDFAWKSYKRLFQPEPYHIVQEIQKYNLPDYRPRMEQFQKAIKKVRAVQRLRRNRGFAFSQTEDGQEAVIRAYDTTKAKLAG